MGPEFFTDFGHGFAIEFLEAFLTSHHSREMANTTIQLIIHFFGRNDQRVQFGLTLQHFAQNHLFKQHAPQGFTGIRIEAAFLPLLVGGISKFSFQLGLQNDFVRNLCQNSFRNFGNAGFG